MNQEDYRQARNSVVNKEAWDACLEFAILHGLPNDLPNYDLEVKRAYTEIETLQDTIEERDTEIAKLKNTIELMSKSNDTQ